VEDFKVVGYTPDLHDYFHVGQSVAVGPFTLRVCDVHVDEVAFCLQVQDYILDTGEVVTSEEYIRRVCSYFKEEQHEGSEGR